MLDTRKWIAIGGSLMVIALLATLVLIVALAIYSRSRDVRPSDEMRARLKAHEA